MKGTALWIFAVYVILWIAIGMEFLDMHRHPYDYGDGKLISFLPMLCVLMSVVYVITLIVLSFRNPARKALYQRLAVVAALPVIAVIIIAASLFH